MLTALNNSPTLGSNYKFDRTQNSDPATNPNRAPAESFRSSESVDAGLMPRGFAQSKDVAKSEEAQPTKESFWDRFGTGAGIGALIGGIAPGVVLPFIGFALAPVGMATGALIGGTVAGFCGKE